MLRNIHKWRKLVIDDNAKAVECVVHGNEPCLRRQGSTEPWLRYSGKLEIDDYPWKPIDDRQCFETWRDIRSIDINPYELEMIFLVSRDFWWAHTDHANTQPFMSLTGERSKQMQAENKAYYTHVIDQLDRHICREVFKCEWGEFPGSTGLPKYITYKDNRWKASELKAAAHDVLQ